MPLTVERKFVATDFSADAALALLSLHCAPDPKYPEGWIESVYFDDPNFTSYREKANGDAFKRKVRIRWYRASLAESSGPATAWLEIKDRVCAARSKVHAGVQADLGELLSTPLDTPYWTELLESETSALGMPPLGRLRPSIEIRYYRHRFICPVTGARIALDTSISSPRANPLSFPSCGALATSRIVCESKFPGANVWTWNESLSRIGFRAGSFSKYGLFMEARLDQTEERNNTK